MGTNEINTIQHQDDSSVVTMLTTADNPFDPFTQFDEWFLFDVEKGYNSCGYLARITDDSEYETEEEAMVETERAIDEIIANDFLNIYTKVYSNEYENDD